MSRLLTLASLAASFTARYPNASTVGTISSLQAGAASGTVESLQAGAVRNFSSTVGRLVYVKVLTPFTAGIDNYCAEGDFLQLEDHEAKGLVHSGRAVLATDAEVAEASKPTSGKAKA